MKWDKEESDVEAGQQQQERLQGQQQGVAPPTTHRHSLKGYNGSNYLVLGGNNGQHVMTVTSIHALY